MESVESPLDVLSRAATMVQDSLPNNAGMCTLNDIILFNEFHLKISLCTESYQHENMKI